MKKFIKILAGLSCMAVVMVNPLQYVSAASEFESDDNIIAGVIGTVSTGGTYEMNPSKIFSSDENFGQDLYEFIYNRVKHEGSDLAVSRTLASRPLSKAELLAIIPGANIGELIKKEPGKELTPKEIESRRLEMMAALVDEKEFADLEVAAKMDVESAELFSNGDESDSGFDLIADLDVIELILFAQSETLMSGTGPGAPASGPVIGIGGGGSGKKSEGSSGAVSGGSGAKLPGSGGGEGATGLGFGSVSGDSGSAGGEGQTSGQQVICPSNQAFNDAVKAAIENEKNLSEEGGRAGAGGSASSSGGQTSGRPGSSGAGAPSGSAPGTAMPSELKPAEAGDWSRKIPCEKSFCLKVEAVYKAESSYQVTDNCIACHFEKMNDSFKKVLDKSLVPSKLTGNMLELPKCKKSYLMTPLGLKFNLIIIPQPIMTPPNDDLVTKGDFIKNAINFYEKYYDNPGRCQSSAGGACKPDPDPSAKAASNTFASAPDDTPQSEILAQIRSQVETKKAQAEQIMKQTRIENEAQSQSLQFRVLMQEINTMNSYFKGFEAVLKQISAPSKGSPCTALLNKSSCP